MHFRGKIYNSSFIIILILILFRFQEVANLLKKMESAEKPQRDSLKREIEFVQRVTSLDERLKSMMEKDEKTNEQLEK